MLGYVSVRTLAGLAVLASMTGSASCFSTSAAIGVRPTLRSSSSSQRAPALSSLRMVAAEPRVMTKLNKNIKTPDPIPEEGIELATELMRSGKLYRYSAADATSCMVSQCEAALANYMDLQYCVALNSCGSAIFMALKCVGAQHGDLVLSNAFTFTAVPSAIVHAGCEPVYVECNDQYLMDPEHLAEMADKTGAKYVVVSHMRGKVADMDAIEEVCQTRGITIVEDCAHSLGVRWNGVHTGHKGVMSCVSSQSYKMLNSGEGGFLLTNDEELAAKMILYAGAYEKLYQKHSTRPADEYFERLKLETPNYSMRMDAARAAMILPQIYTLDERIAVYNRRYEVVKADMNKIPHLTVPDQLDQVSPVYDSVQFNIRGISEQQLDAFVAGCAARGVPVEVFGAKTNARYFRNWKYTEKSQQQFDSLPKTEHIIQWAGDLRLPLMFEEEDFKTMTTAVAEAMADATREE